jgi:hypothetical protein
MTGDFQADVEAIPRIDARPRNLGRDLSDDGGGLCSQVVAEDCDELFARAGRGSVAVAAGNPLS